eukprot:m.114731 g.114731  ORF g.114731 m.114731 type:complete len:565 (-) comp28369_c0_seq1:401-2095(-)
MSDTEDGGTKVPLGRMVPVELYCPVHDGIPTDGERMQMPMKLDIDSKYLSLAITSKYALPKTLMPTIDSVVHTFRDADTQANQDEEDLQALDPRSMARSRTGAMSWAQMFSMTHSSYRQPARMQEEHNFAMVYHESIHSPALFTLLQLEHTYGMNVAALVEQRDRAIQQLEEINRLEMDKLLNSKKKTDMDIRRLTAIQSRGLQTKHAAFSKDIYELKKMQKNDYHEYVQQLFYAEKSAPSADSPKRYMRSQTEGDGGKEDDRKQSSSMLKRATNILRRNTSEELPRNISTHSAAASPLPQRLEESFTIHLGTQKKTSHNLRLMADNVINICRRDMVAEFEETQAERLQTAMALYSTKQLQAIIHLVNNNIESDPTDFAKICELSTDFHFDSFEEQMNQLRNDMIGLRQNGDDENDNTQKQLSLETGDFYVTKHSNLAGIHTAFHLCINEDIQKSDLNTRSPVIAGLRNILRTAFQHGISTITVPLLMLEKITEEMTPKWQLRRAELVLKCIKGFILENSVSGSYQSKTVEFLVPPETSVELFDAFSGMLSNTFRVAGTMNLGS